MVNTHIASVGNQMTQHNRSLGHRYRPLGHLPTPKSVETQAQRAWHILHLPVPPLPSALAQRPPCTGMGRKRERHSRDSVVVKVTLPDPAALQSPVSKHGPQRLWPRPTCPAETQDSTGRLAHRAAGAAELSLVLKTNHILDMIENQQAQRKR